MKYLSVCSGIEAASVAWAPLGFSPVAFAEVEPFPCAVLARHYPDVPNLGDMTMIDGSSLRGRVHVLEGDKDYADCIEEFVMQPDMPESLFAIFDKAYTERKFVNVPPQVLIGIWTTRKGRNIDDDLRMAAEQAAKAK